MQADAPAIEARNLSKRFGDIIAVNNLNLRIERGATYALLGPNGAGKTTTVRILNGLIEPTSGVARVLGMDIRNEKESIKLVSGFLPESPGLYTKLTAYEFLEFIGELYGVPKQTLVARIEDLLSLFELSDRADQLLENYSRGMKQKVCLASTLVPDPSILFLDEPTSNLDPASTRMVKGLIKELSKSAEKTIFICTHLLPIAEELCDKIGFINNGIRVMEGSVSEIIERVQAKDLEDAYMKVMEIQDKSDFLGWRG